MPALPFAAQVIKMEVSGTRLGDPWANIWHMKYDGGPASNTDLEDIYTFASAQILRPYIHNMDEYSSVTLVAFTDLSSDTGATYENTTVSAGTNSGGTIPGSASFLVSHQILRRYRGGHPRHYMPFGQASDIEANNQWASSFFTNSLTDVQNMITMLNSYSGGSITALNMGNLSYISGGEVRDTPVFDVYLGTVGRTRVCTQRRRLGKTGG